MTSIIDTLRVPRSHNKNVKLPLERHSEVRAFYKHCGSYRATAKQYNVSRRLVQFIVDPSKRERAKKQFKERQEDGRYYDREKQRLAAQRHRAYKRRLIADGVIDPTRKAELEKRRAAKK